MLFRSRTGTLTQQLSPHCAFVALPLCSLIMAARQAFNSGHSFMLSSFITASLKGFLRTVLFIVYINNNNNNNTSKINGFSSSICPPAIYKSYSYVSVVLYNYNVRLRKCDSTM